MKYINENDFEQIYDDTYKKVLKFAILKCNNTDDLNDVIQDTYTEFYKILLKKKKIETDNLEAFICGICKNIIKRHYHKIKRLEKEEEIKEENLPDEFDLESNIITSENAERVWKYLKNKNEVISKIFYLYFGLEEKISEIAKELKLTESNVKNKIYRTLKELKKHLERM